MTTDYSLADGSTGTTTQVYGEGAETVSAPSDSNIAQTITSLAAPDGQKAVAAIEDVDSATETEAAKPVEGSVVNG